MSKSESPDDEPSEPGRPRPRLAAPDTQTNDAPISDQPRAANSDHPPRGDYWMACLVSWLGILVASGLYAILFEITNNGSEPIFTLFAGVIVAGVVSVPVGVTVTVLAWSFWLSRFQISLMTLVGACTGIVSATPIALGMFRDEAIPMIFLAGCLGGSGAGLAAYFYWTIAGRPIDYVSKHDATVWSFSTRDLFWRFTVLALLIATWSGFFKWIFRH